MNRSRWDITFIAFIIVLVVFTSVSFITDIFILQIDCPLSQCIKEPWRIVSGHLVHANGSHLLLNLVNIILLRLVFREWLPTQLWLAFTGFSAIFISLGLWVISSLSDYVGFSGIFHGLVLYLLLYHQERTNHKTMRLLLISAMVLLTLKVAYEQTFGASVQLASFIGMTVAIEAHLLGLISGLLFWLLVKTLSSRLL